MADPVEDILRLVAEGRLTPAEAAPILDALGSSSRASGGPGTGPTPGGPGTGPTPGGPGPAGGTGRPPGPAGSPGATTAGMPDRIRVQVRDNGRVVVDLQVPGVLAGLASSLPGIPTGYADRVREAIRKGFRGPVVDIRDEDDSGLTITID